IVNHQPEECLCSRFLTRRPTVSAVVLQSLGNGSPWTFAVAGEVEIDRLIGDILVKRAPANNEGAVFGHLGARQLGSWSGGVNFDPHIGHIARSRRIGAEAAAIAYHHADAKEAFSGQLDLSGALAFGVFRPLLPGLTHIFCAPNLNAAHAAGARLL